MANYFVLNNKFTPYSFDELIKPYQMYAKEYDKEEAALEAAGEKEFTAADLSSNPDSAAYKMYSEATNALQAASDELATKGLTGDLRNRIRTVARDYKRTMGNLNDAQDKLDKEIDRRVKLGSDYVFQDNDLSIDNFLNGSNPNQKGESLSKITRDITTNFGLRAKALNETSWGRPTDANGNPIGGFWDIISKTGLTSAELALVLDSNSVEDIDKNTSLDSETKAVLKEFRKVIDKEKEAIGYDKFKDASDRESIDQAIRLGAAAALEETSHSVQRDPDHDTYARLNYYDRKDSEQYKYPQYKWNPEKHDFVRDKDGNLIINEGWKQDPQTRKWYHKDYVGERQGRGGSGSTNESNLGVKIYGKHGEVSQYGSAKEANEDNSDTFITVTNASELSEQNKNRLAIDLGMVGTASPEEILAEAIRRGVSVSIRNHNKDEKQEMKVVWPKSQKQVTGPSSGGQSTEGDYDPDAPAE